MKIQKKKMGGGSGGRVGGVRLGGDQVGCDQRIEVLGKIHKKKSVWGSVRGGGGGGGGGVGSGGGGFRLGGSGWM